MKVDEARRIKTMMRKMTETKHQDEASAVLTQLHRRAAQHGKDLAHLVAEAELTLAGKAPAAPPADQAAGPTARPTAQAGTPETASDEPAVQAAAAPRARVRWRSRQRGDDGAELQRHLASWQDTVLLIVLIGIVFYAVLFGGEDDPRPVAAPPPVPQTAPTGQFQ